MKKLLLTPIYWLIGWWVALVAERLYRSQENDV